MSKASLKKTLGSMSREEIIESICELYDSRREAKEYLEYWLNPDPDSALESYKETIDKMFFFSSGKNRAQPAANELKRQVKYFSSLVFDSEKTADLMLHIAERQYIWLTRRTSGFLQAEGAVRRAYEQARTYIEAAALEGLYGLRLERLKDCIDAFYKNPPEPRRAWWRRRRY